MNLIKKLNNRVSIGYIAGITFIIFDVFSGKPLDDLTGGYAAYTFLFGVILTHIAAWKAIKEAGQ